MIAQAKVRDLEIHCETPPLFAIYKYIDLEIQTGKPILGAYHEDIERRIKRAWFPAKGNEDKKVKVIFKVHKGGNITNLGILISSGIQAADAAALKAVQNATPFRPLPDGMGDDVYVEFTFEYNTFNGGGGGAFRQF